MVLDVQDALVIASLMMGGDGRNLSNLQLDDLTLSAIADVWIHCHIYGVTVIQADRYWISAYQFKGSQDFRDSG